MRANEVWLHSPDLRKSKRCDLGKSSQKMRLMKAQAERRLRLYR